MNEKRMMEKLITDSSNSNYNSVSNKNMGNLGIEVNLPDSDSIDNINLRNLNSNRSSSKMEPNANTKQFNITSNNTRATPNAMETLINQ